MLDLTEQPSTILSVVMKSSPLNFERFSQNQFEILLSAACFYSSARYAYFIESFLFLKVFCATSCVEDMPSPNLPTTMAQDTAC